ncbi:MAG: carbohydrate-binding domain-containing protein, partial [Lachnospiraceae bacterium]|nr:carbohydrate-binding domain-containing protein [Lachnospiraceae bacterium]
AANPVTSVKIGSATLNETNKYYHNGVNGEQGVADTNADGANAEFDAATGTLTLKGLNIKNTDSNYRGIFWEYSYTGNDDLVIVLESGSTNSVTNTSGTGINGNEGFDDGPSLTIKGNGTLNVNASGSGIWVWENITIQEDVVLNVTSTGAMGIANNSHGGKITIKDNAKVTTTGDTYGIGCSNYIYETDNSIIVDGGSITSSGGTAAFFLEPDLSSYAAFTMNVGDTAP